MKKYIIALILFCVVSLSGCLDSMQIKQCVITKYKTLDVWDIPNYTQKFVVRKPDGSVWYVFAYEDGNSVVQFQETQLFSANVKIDGENK